ncbi:MAG: hypothetical protein LBK69_07365 [Syntrophomonadaceae bacterium]|jgi:hypothetical protein|nr:hypothetical protein [Syntrophomonadaceae bacterium]
MPDLVLIKALLNLIDQASFGQASFGTDGSIYVTCAIAMVSTFGLLYMVYQLLGYDKNTQPHIVLSAFLLGIPYILLCAVGIFVPMLFSPFMTSANQTLLERSEVLPLFESARLFYEVMALCAAFAVICALYIAFTQRRLAKRRGFKSWLTAVAFSCGFEIIAAAGLLTVSLLQFAGVDLPLSHSFAGRLFFYSVAMVLLKLSEQVFVLIYVELFGVKRLGEAIAQIPDTRCADFNTLKWLARKQYGFMPPLVLALLIGIVCKWAFWHSGLFGASGTAAALMDSTILLGTPFILILLMILIMRSFWFLLPETCPLLRQVSRLRFADETSRQLIREYEHPLFIDGDTLATPHFFIRESLSTRAYYLPDLVRISITVGGLGAVVTKRQYMLHFSDRSKLIIAPEQRKLLQYVRRIFTDAGGEIESAPRPSSWVKAIAVLLLIPLSAAVLIVFVMRGQINAENETFSNSYFKENIAKYEYIVQMIEDGEINLTGSARELVPLPREYAELSRGGSVLVSVNENGINVIFFRQISIFGSFEGYKFTADGLTPVN